MIHTRLRMLAAVCALLALACGCSTPQQNRVLSLNGATQYATVPDAPPLRLASGDFTLAAYIYINEYGPSNHAILSKRGSGNRDGWTFFVAGNFWPQLARRVLFHVSLGDNPFIVSRSTLEAATWYHVALVYQAASETAILYLDGVEDARTPGITAPNASTMVDLHLGRDSSADRYHFNGMIDDVAVFDRALTPEEVVILGKTTLSGNESNLLVYWHFDRADTKDTGPYRFDARLVE
jgi:hypothetical protein